jgi:hypothetical protein
MSRKIRTPRVSAAYAALLFEAWRSGGRLSLRVDEADGSVFRQRLLRANVLVQLGLLSPHQDRAFTFDLTPSGRVLAQGEPGPMGEGAEDRSAGRGR